MRRAHDVRLRRGRKSERRRGRHPDRARESLTTTPAHPTAPSSPSATADDVETIVLDDVDVDMTSETSSAAPGTTETVPHDKSPRDAPMTKTIARGGDDGARVVSLGATCYGACVASVAVRSRDEGGMKTPRERWARLTPSTAHFSLRDAETGDVARDTREDMEPVQFVVSERFGLNDALVDGRRAGANIEAMDACARTMTPGERATFDVPASLAYGEEGHFSFPTIGKNRRLILDLEILDARGSAEAPERVQRDMTYEERVAAARGHRSRGNELFVAGDAARAIREYSMALTYLTEDFMMQLFGAYEEEAHAEFVAAHGNLAAAHLRLESYADALTHVAFVLKVDDANAKAYYRRGKARFALGQEDAAREDYVRSQRLAGGTDAAVAAAIRELDAVVRARERESAKAFKGMFDDASNDAPSAPLDTDDDSTSPRTDSHPGIFGRVASFFRASRR